MKFKIMVVENDLLQLEYWKKILQKASYDTLLYSDGRQARDDIYLGLDYDILITDISLGENNTLGNEILEASKENYPNRPVFGTTAYFFYGKNNGQYSFDYMFIKDFDYDDLLKCINKHLCNAQA